MAVTSIWPIKGRVDKVINYARNPEKTHDKEIKEAPPADIPLLLRAMRQGGYNLDQTLKRFNSTNVPDMPQFRKDLEGIRAATKMVSDAYTSDYQ